MKANALKMAIIAGFALTAGMANAKDAENQPVSIRNVKLLDEQVVTNPSETYKSNNWERREGWGERRERREGWRERRR